MRGDSPFWVGVATIVTLCIVTLTMRFLPSAMPEWRYVTDMVPGVRNILDAPACSADNCTVQAWLSALSGYFALLAAIIGVGITWRGLKHQARQTDFTLGYGRPDFRMSSTGNQQRPATYEFINWNKKSIYFKSIEICPPLLLSRSVSIQPIELNYRKIAGEKKFSNKLVLEDGALVAAQGIDGWLNRQNGPAGWRFRLKFEDRQDLDEYILKSRCRVRLGYVLHNDRGQAKLRYVMAEARLWQILGERKPK